MAAQDPGQATFSYQENKRADSRVVILFTLPWSMLITPFTGAPFTARGVGAQQSLKTPL